MNIYQILNDFDYYIWDMDQFLMREMFFLQRNSKILMDFFQLAVPALVWLPSSWSKLEVPMNFNAIFKTVKIIEIGQLEPKIWKFDFTP